MIVKISDLPEVRGRYKENAPLGVSGWFGAGGNVDVLYKPADTEDLSLFLEKCPSDVPVNIVGAMSNVIIRDGGVRGVVIRLGRGFNDIEYVGDAKIKVGSAALDKNIAIFAADAGISGMEFLSGIPGSIGGAVFMNAGSYGQDMKSVLVYAEAVLRNGEIVKLSSEDLNMTYRHSEIPDGAVITGCLLKGSKGEPAFIHNRIEEIRKQRVSSQPVGVRTGGSTFANPEGYKAWELIERAGCRDLKVGGAKMSDIHCNFMINDGTASASDLENLGEKIRRRVRDDSRIELRWEIKRLGEKNTNQD